MAPRAASVCLARCASPSPRPPPPPRAHLPIHPACGPRKRQGGASACHSPTRARNPRRRTRTRSYTARPAPASSRAAGSAARRRCARPPAHPPAAARTRAPASARGGGELPRCAPPPAAPRPCPHAPCRPASAPRPRAAHSAALRRARPRGPISIAAAPPRERPARGRGSAPRPRPPARVRPPRRPPPPTPVPRAPRPPRRPAGRPRAHNPPTPARRAPCPPPFKGLLGPLRARGGALPPPRASSRAPRPARCQPAARAPAAPARTALTASIPTSLPHPPGRRNVAPPSVALQLLWCARTASPASPRAQRAPDMLSAAPGRPPSRRSGPWRLPPRAHAPLPWPPHAGVAAACNTLSDGRAGAPAARRVAPAAPRRRWACRAAAEGPPRRLFVAAPVPPARPPAALWRRPRRRPRFWRCGDDLGSFLAPPAAQRGAGPRGGVPRTDWRPGVAMAAGPAARMERNVCGPAPAVEPVTVVCGVRRRAGVVKHHSKVFSPSPASPMHAARCILRRMGRFSARNHDSVHLVRRPHTIQGTRLRGRSASCTRVAAVPALPLDVDFNWRPEHLAI